MERRETNVGKKKKSVCGGRRGVEGDGSGGTGEEEAREGKRVRGKIRHAEGVEREEGGNLERWEGLRIGEVGGIKNTTRDIWSWLGA